MQASSTERVYLGRMGTLWAKEYWSPIRHNAPANVDCSRWYIAENSPDKHDTWLGFFFFRTTLTCGGNKSNVHSIQPVNPCIITRALPLNPSVPPSISGMIELGITWFSSSYWSMLTYENLLADRRIPTYASYQHTVDPTTSNHRIQSAHDYTKFWKVCG